MPQQGFCTAAAVEALPSLHGFYSALAVKSRGLWELHFDLGRQVLLTRFDSCSEKLHLFVATFTAVVCHKPGAVFLKVAATISLRASCCQWSYTTRRKGLQGKRTAPLCVLFISLDSLQAHPAPLC
jgi:hypothetical protein